MSFVRLALALVAGLPAAVAHAADHAAPARLLHVTPHTRHLSVTEGETVSIRVGGATYTRLIAAPRGVRAFSLSELVPAAIALGEIRVLVAPARRQAGA
ncbi:hypothetical protein B0920_15005 [Massilia sp. KIM]|uniref:CzcE family metal-binding protein n=1 Tax=Massilia sp. KIM TaxID=1955422 RepID=UPI00098F00CB|nr:CzcE family metal-binding protein [Massilia sp. KIM]OON60301.1 hypothetical protein B0920_15005 [Massilia sp. KIM]